MLLLSGSSGVALPRWRPDHGLRAGGRRVVNLRGSLDYTILPKGYAAWQRGGW